MKKIFLSLLLILPLIVSAAEWQVVGPRALGMGGAYVAVVNDSTAAYWNPAAFGFYKTKEVRKYEDRDFGLGIGVGAGYSIHNNLGEKIDDILNYDYDAVANDINNGVISISNLHDYVNLINNVAKITDKDAVVFKANGYVASRIGHFGVGVYALGNIAALPILDLQNISVNSGDTDIINSLAGVGGDTTQDVLTATQYTELVNTISSFTGWSYTDAQNFVNTIDDSLKTNGITSIDDETYNAVINTAKIASNAQTGGSYDKNESKIKFSGFIYYEIPISYGYAINKNFSVGANVKFMKGRYYESYVSLYDDNNDNDLFDNAKDDYAESNTFGIDAGAMYKLGNMVTLGIVGRNLNTPKFDKPFGGEYKLDPQARGGVAFTPFGWLTLAADIDLIENDTNINGYKSQNVAFGAEFELLKFLALRAGYYKNLAESDINGVYTAGLGLNLYLLRLDAGLAFSDKTSKVDGNDIPNEVKAEVALSFEF
ncbi:conjugal transfer protein TraF [Deferribacteraceae bacterium V6Fe1]|nr:conjugal transfer protein TraF [Deferribacteraceae bacterium V6Fe1]